MSGILVLGGTVVLNVSRSWGSGGSILLTLGVLVVGGIVPMNASRSGGRRYYPGGCLAFSCSEALSRWMSRAMVLGGIIPMDVWRFDLRRHYPDGCLVFWY